jgi:two-component system sensor histidine kinase BaeS
VTDTGIGIAPEHLSRVFERFYRVDKSRSRAHGGAGVGLTIAQALAEMMGGRITARSEGTGRGSTFTFELPVAEGRVRQESPVSVATSPALSPSSASASATSPR